MLKRLATLPVQVIWVFGLILAGHILVGGGADAAPDRERRIALVIGNGAYEATSPLNNPVPDARLIADTLRSLDFEVAERLDVGQIEMKCAIRDFGELLYEAGQDVIGLFY